MGKEEEERGGGERRREEDGWRVSVSHTSGEWLSWERGARVKEKWYSGGQRRERVERDIPFIYRNE